MPIILTLAVMALLLVVARTLIASSLGRLTSRLKVLDVENAVLAARLRNAEERRLRAEQQAASVIARHDSIRAVVSDMASEIEVLRVEAKLACSTQSESTRTEGSADDAGGQTISST